MSEEVRTKLLLFGYLPPPVFGPSIACQTLLRSSFASHFDITFINLSVVRNIRELESFRIAKLFGLVKFWFIALTHLATKRYDLCGYPISFNRNALLKDTVLLSLVRAFRVPTVLFAHGTGVQEFRATLSSRLRRLFDNALTIAAGVIVLADCLRADFESLVRADRILVVTPGIEPQPSPPAQARRAAAGPVILYLGIMRRNKGVFDLLEAMPLVLAGRSDAKLVLAGEWFRGDEETEALAFIAAHNLNGAVEEAGLVVGPEKQRLLCSADLLVFPCHAVTEAFGLVMLEAMQAGLPMVATSGGARNEVIADGVNGLLVEERNARDLADKILRLTEDRPLRERIGRANREKFNQLYTHEHYGRRMIEVLTELRRRHEAIGQTPPNEGATRERTQ